MLTPIWYLVKANVQMPGINKFDWRVPKVGTFADALTFKKKIIADMD
jgi:hypothetical protein